MHCLTLFPLPLLTAAASEQRQAVQGHGGAHRHLRARAHTAHVRATGPRRASHPSRIPLPRSKSPRTDVLATARPDPVVTQLASDPLGTVDYAGLLLHEATRQRGVRAKHQMKEALHAVAQAKGQPHASVRRREGTRGPIVARWH